MTTVFEPATNGHRPNGHQPPHPPGRGRLDPDQIDQLLLAIDPRRVVDDGRGHAAVAGQDIKAHLTRIFGFGGWSHTITDRELMFCDPVPTPDGTPSWRFGVCWRVEVELRVYDRRGLLVAVHHGGNMDTVYGAKGSAMQRAYTGAETLALKRAATSLGDQFGLSLYDGGSLRPIVGGVLGHSPDSKHEDVQHVAPAPRADEMTGADPTDAAEVERLRAYQAARRAAEGRPDPAPAEPVSDEQAREWLIEEVRFLDQLTPGLADRIEYRLGDGATMETTAVGEVLAVVGHMRMIAVLPLRKAGLHDEADRYQAADPNVAAPLATLLGRDPADVLAALA